MKPIYGVGVNDKKYPAYVNGKPTKEYDLWRHMLQRCYCQKYHTKKPTYVGCSVSEKFRHYSFFYEWVSQQIGFGVDGFHLDKDILIPNNKLYSEDVCVFVPHEINTFFNDCDNARGEFPIGVNFHKASGKFRALCSVNGKQQHLGLFSTAKEAFTAYKQFKEALSKEIAKKWQPQIDNRVYAAMMLWGV